ncbi:kinase-like domain-containing protein [Hygrophoropsis aurantiaca]|uniref:Kinase-like domain-containing protein n=1 Tax=Hygrophoropsis aurantiaca TaxID=72124 RepID=A0ACB8AUX7_9AGAM|nr:kinase-like domain-containing protein [Hygrophoropsis aurantiaca]
MGFIKRAISRVFNADDKDSGQRATPDAAFTRGYLPRSPLTETDSDASSADRVALSDQQKRERVPISPFFLLNLILRLHGVTTPVRNAIIARLSGSRVQVTPRSSIEAYSQPEVDNTLSSPETIKASPHYSYRSESLPSTPHSLSFDVDPTAQRPRRPSHATQEDVATPIVSQLRPMRGASRSTWISQNATLHESDSIESSQRSHHSNYFGFVPSRIQNASLLVHSGGRGRAKIKTATTSARPRRDAVCALKHKNHTFAIKHTIGNGGFGTVWYATTEIGEEVAIKVINKVLAFSVYMPKSGDPGYTNGRTASDLALSTVENELDILRRVTTTGSPFLTPLLHAFSDEESFYFVMNFYPQTLRQRLEDCPFPLQLSQIKIWAAELVLAMEALHDLNVMHRDLKTDNILITPSGHLCVGDFGVSFALALEQSHELFKVAITSDEAGTAQYQAPEQRSHFIRNTRGYNYKVDMYAVGLALVEMFISHARAWYRKFDPSFVISIGEDDSPPLDHVVTLVLDKAGQDLCEKLLSEHPDDRPDWEHIREHRFFADIDWDLASKRGYATRYRACCRDRDLPIPGAMTDHCSQKLGSIAYVQHKAYIEEEAQWGRGLGTLKFDYTGATQVSGEYEGHGRSCLADYRTKCKCSSRK